MDEFTKADLDDWQLERAADRDIEHDDWLELHGLNRYCPHHDEPLDGYGKCRECYWQDRAWREDHPRPTPDDVLRYTGRGGENLHD